jgi:hypothetical protein
MTMKLLGLAGHAGAGKDYTYAALKADLAPQVVERVAFADGLKFDIEEALGVTPYDIPALRDKPYSPEVRSFLQWWGTELRREQYGDDYWVLKGMEMVEEMAGYADLVVVTDVRFQNEADAIRKSRGMVAEVWATREVRSGRLGGDLPPSHASEVIDFEVDARISSMKDGQVRIPPGINRYLGRAGAYSVISP